MKFNFLILLLIMPLTSAQLFMSEIMYDYPGTDTKFEWIEIYNNDSQSINITNYKLREGSTNHALTLIQGTPILPPNSYAIIADDSTTFILIYPLFNSTLFDTTFTSGLSNSGEELTLINFNNLNITSIFYNTSLGANGNNNTLCLFNNSWQECIATPGMDNFPDVNLTTDNNASNSSTNTTNTPFNDSVPKINIKIISYLENSLFINQNYNHFFKIIIENKDNCSIQDNLTVSYNITLSSSNSTIKSSNFTKTIGCNSYSSTGDFTPPIAENYTICGQIISSSITTETNLTDNNICYSFTVQDPTYSFCDQDLSIETGESIIYNQSQSINFQPKINNNSFSFVIEYWIEDIFGNILKNKLNTTNLNQKSWKTNIEEQDRVLFVKAIIYPQCNDTNKSNNFAEKMFIVTNTIINFNSTTTNYSNSSIIITPTPKENKSTIQINKISPNTPSYGELIKIDTTIYKGSTSKYSLSFYVEQDGHKISEITTLHLNTKFQDYDLTIPLQIKPNCEEIYEDGFATIIIEGLDQHVEHNFNIEGLNNILCKYYSSTDTSSSTKSSSTKNTSIKISTPKTSKSKINSSNNKNTPTYQNIQLSSQPTYIFLNSSPPTELLPHYQPNSPGFTVYESNTTKAKNLLPYILIITTLLIGLILFQKNK